MTAPTGSVAAGLLAIDLPGPGRRLLVVPRPPWFRLAIGLAAISVANLLAQAVRGWRGVPHTDYLALATAARVLASGSRCIYCLPVEAQAQAELLGHRPDIGVMPYANPPLAAWLWQPVTALSLRVSAGVFLAASLVALAAAGALLLRLLRPSPARPSAVLVVICAVAVVPGASALAYLQWAPLLLLAVAGAGLLAEPRDRLAAGLVLSACLVKPQVVWLVVPALLVGRHWRTLAGLLAGGCVWLGSAVAIAGIHGLADWYRSNVPMDIDDVSKTAGIPGLMSGLTGARGASFMIAVICALASIAVLWSLRASLRDDRLLAMGLGTVLSLLAAPHVFPADLLLLASPLVLIARRWPGLSIAAAGTLAAASFIDGRLPTDLAHTGTVAVAGLAVAVVLTARGSGRESVHAATPPGVAIVS